MLARGQKKPLPMLLRGAEPLLVEHRHSSKGWSPTRRARGRPSAGTASTPRSLTPRNQFGRDRLAQRLRLEAYSLPSRSGRCTSDCVGGGKATMRLVCVGGGGRKREERAESQASTNQTRSAGEAGSFYHPQDLPAQRSCLSLSGHSAQQSTCGSRYSDVC